MCFYLNVLSLAPAKSTRQNRLPVFILYCVYLEMWYDTMTAGAYIHSTNMYGNMVWLVLLSLGDDAVAAALGFRLEWYIFLSRFSCLRLLLSVVCELLPRLSPTYNTISAKISKRSYTIIMTTTTNKLYWNYIRYAYGLITFVMCCCFCVLCTIYTHNIHINRRKKYVFVFFCNLFCQLLPSVSFAAEIENMFNIWVYRWLDFFLCCMWWRAYVLPLLYSPCTSIPHLLAQRRTGWLAVVQG